MSLTGINHLYKLRNISGKDLDLDKHISLPMFQEESTSRLFHKTNKPPFKVVWLVYQTSFSLSKNK